MHNLSNTDLAHLLDQPIFHHLSAVADDLQLECYTVGGYVRDPFLKRPSNDIDVAAVGSGTKVTEALKQRLDKQAHLLVFRSFGTTQVKYRGQEVEFVGARKESYNHDSCKLVVEGGILEDDQNRRDFAINTMAVCLNEVRFGELVDPSDGPLDSEDGIIRTSLDPDTTFSDDPLRMTHCVRFATQLRFFIEDGTPEALQRNREHIKIVSGECIADELNKIMIADHSSRGFVELHRCGLLGLILPEFTLVDIVETRNGRAYKNNFYHILEAVDNIYQYTDNLWLRWAALFHDIGKPRGRRWDVQTGWTSHDHNYIGPKMIPSIFRRLKFPMDSKMKHVQKMVDMHMRPITTADEEATDSAVRRLMNDTGDDIDGLMTLCEADTTSKNAQRKQRFLDNFHMVYEKLDDLKECDYKRLLQPCIDGNEIMEMFHLQPSREVGTLKQILEDAALDNKVPNEREPLMALLIEKAKKMGLDVSQKQE